MFRKNARTVLKGFLTGCLLASLSVHASAQVMSDEQIVSFVQSEHAAGKDQATIASELLSRGVSRERIAQISQRYSGMRSNGASLARTESFDRGRVDNSEAVNLEFVDQNTVQKSAIFGHDVFRSKNLSFAPSMNVATPVTYILGPGDEIILDVFGASQSSAAMKVSPDGTIVVDKVGPVHVSGMTVAQAERALRQKVGQHYQSSDLKVTVGQTRAIVVNVLGEVNTPGTYSISAFSSVFNALYLAGGITDIGTIREIKVIRNGRVISTVDVYDYILNGNLTGNIMLTDNDVINVGTYDRLVKVSGSVKRPMYYELKGDENLSTLVGFAGGFTGNAFRDRIRVERMDAHGLGVHTVENGEYDAFMLNDGDIVSIDSVVDRYHDMVQVSGAVFHPGKYSLKSDCNSVKTLVEMAGGLMEDAVRGRASLYRMNEDRTKREISIDLAAVIDGKAPDVLLMNEDELVIGSEASRIYGKTLQIFGEVHKPGTYAYSQNQTLQNLIIAAGGLRDEASLLNVEVARSIIYLSEEERSEVDDRTSSKIYSIVLKDGLPIDGDTDFKLQPKDVVTIHTSPDFDNHKVMMIEGEVQYAGMYVLTDVEERLSDIVTRAGGLKSTAYPSDAVLIRRLSDEETARKDKLIRLAHSSDSTDIRTLDIANQYYVGIDLKKALADPGSEHDIVLREGDILRIPTYNNTVSVNGEVLNPNVVSFVPGKGLGFYINQGGGYTARAHRRKVYIIYANGQVSRASRGEIKPGCEILVPTRPERKIDATQAGMWNASAATMATIGSLLINALRK